MTNNELLCYDPLLYWTPASLPTVWVDWVCPLVVLAPDVQKLLLPLAASSLSPQQDYHDVYAPSCLRAAQVLDQVPFCLSSRQHRLLLASDRSSIPFGSLPSPRHSALTLQRNWKSTCCVLVSCLHWSLISWCGIFSPPSVTPRALITESTNDSPSSRYGFPKNLVCRSSSVFISSDQWQRPSAWYLSWIEGQSGQLVLCGWEGILYWWVQSLPAIDWYFWRAERVWKEYQKEGNQEHSLCIFELSAFWLDSNWTPIFRQSISICLHNPSTVWFRSLWTLLLPCSPLRRLLICWCSRRCPGRDPKRDWRRSVLLMALTYITVSPADC